MNGIPDDMEMLIGEIQKTISDNRRFLETLANDNDPNDAPVAQEEANEANEEEFEEL